VIPLLARSREAGTEETARARRELAAFLAGHGYSVIEHPFSCSPRALAVLPVVGSGLVALALLLAPLLLIAVPPWLPLAVLVTGVALVTALAAATGLGRLGDLHASRTDANLIVTRAAQLPRCWIVAHLDTKAQGHSLAGRLVAIGLAILALLAALGAVLWRIPVAIPAEAALGVTILLLVAGGLLLRGRLEGQSSGACDNGSGLLALLTAAEHNSDPGLGFVITSAEEFGMLGAEALARERPDLFRQATVINLDTLDDRGTLFVVRHDDRSAMLGRRAAELFADIAPRIRERRLPIGILVDSLPLSEVARETITLGRLDWATLKRIHTPADAPGTLQYTTARAVGQTLASRFDRLTLRD
jgi:hypothetical protein